MSDDHHQFNAERIFILLFILTAVEVAWGYAFVDSSRTLLWGGLILAAVWKAWLIAQNFMHFKFEGWIIKSLIIPTPFLIAYVLVMISPDISRNDNLREPIGSMYDPADGEVKNDMAELSFSVESGHEEGGGGH